MKDQRRSHVYFSIKDPLDKDGKCTGRPVHYYLQNPIVGVTSVAWPIDEDHDAIFVVEVQRCMELSLRLRQNQTAAVLCADAIPPECISKIIDLRGNVLYQNDLLNQIVPGDRKAKLDLGRKISQARIYLKFKNGMDAWPKNIIEPEGAAIERKSDASYDRNVNDEQVCAKCHQLCFKGIRFCTKCHKAKPCTIGTTRTNGQS